MSESKPTLHREQIAGMNIHYIMWSLDYFLDVQQRLGFESIELWCAEPHVTLDHTGYFELRSWRKRLQTVGLGIVLCVPRMLSILGSTAHANRCMNSAAWRTLSTALSLPRYLGATACPSTRAGATGTRTARKPGSAAASTCPFWRSMPASTVWCLRWKACVPRRATL